MYFLVNLFEKFEISMRWIKSVLRIFIEEIKDDTYISATKTIIFSQNKMKAPETMLTKN